MSGWDEGAVYYSAQAQLPPSRGGGGGDNHSMVVKLKEFIRGFELEKKRYPYTESLVNNSRSLVLNLEHLHAFDPHLPSNLHSSRADFLPLFESAAGEMVASLKLKVADDNGEMEEPLAPDVQILLTSNEDPISMRSLGAQYISKLVKISGIIIVASHTKAKDTCVTLVCKNCCNVKMVPCRPGLGGAIIPRSCDYIPQPGEEACPIDPWLLVPDTSRYVDQHSQTPGESRGCPHR